MNDLDDAVRMIVESAARAGDVDIDSVPLDAIGTEPRILARDLALDRDHPPFDRATRDGVACRAGDVRPGSRLRITGEIPAGGTPGTPPPPGAAVRIATGAAVPAPLDAVIEQERLTEAVAGSGNGRSEPAVHVDLEAVAPGRHVHPQGADGAAGRVVARAGSRVDAALVGIAATIGLDPLPVRRRPVVAVMSTGDELRPATDPLLAPEDRYRIRDSNRPMLRATLVELGAGAILADRVADRLEATVDGLRKALARAELVLTIGGVSVGARDHVPHAAESLGLVPGLRGVRVQPGRPTSTWHDADGRLRVLGLPGNPVSCLVCTHLFVRPWIEGRLGLPIGSDWSLRMLEQAVEVPVDRVLCRPARDDARSARVATWQGSGDLPHLAGTTGLVRLPAADDGRRKIAAGTPVPFLPWRPGPLHPHFEGRS